jgi:hypothetical protein
MLVMSLFGCSTFVKNTYTALDATAMLYDAAAPTACTFNQAGKITADQWTKITDASNIFSAAWPLAINGLVSYNDNPVTTAQGGVTLALNTVLTDWSQVANLLVACGINVPTTVSGSMTITKKGGAFVIKGETVEQIPFSVTVVKLKVAKAKTGKAISPALVEIIIQIGEAVVTYVVPAVESFITNLSKSSIADSDINALLPMVKPIQSFCVPPPAPASIKK